VSKPKVCILRSAGTNCDRETAAAFEMAGADTELLHVNRLTCGERAFKEFQILALPGGFSYGDDVASGKILANELRFRLFDGLREFISGGKLVIGICNGFQVLVKSGLLPGVESASGGLKQEASLIMNDSGKFEARWVYLKSEGRCIWTKGLKDLIYLPVAHGEGKFVVSGQKVLNRLKKNRQVVLKYCDGRGRLSGYPDNPNGSLAGIAGITDRTGRVLGLMPHPERHILSLQHPRKEKRAGLKGDGLGIFKNGVEYARKNF